ncbi:MAG TPA: SDR family NAD(P)-dependent oxidoreductase, partial [Puia sp.]
MPDHEFTGKVAIITGAGQGIGFEMARQLVASGAHIVLNDLDARLAGEAVQRIRQEREAGCLAMGGDSGDLSFIQKMVAAAVSEFGKLDIVIANAGITLFGDFLHYPPESFFRVLQV